MVCTLVEKEGKQNWCERHRMEHNGHYATYATDPGEKGQQFRKLWDDIAKGTHAPPVSTLLPRSYPLNSPCRHLGPATGETIESTAPT